MVKVLPKTMIEDSKLYDGIARLYVTAQNSMLGMSRDIIKGNYCEVYVKFAKRLGSDGSLVPTIEFASINVNPRYQGRALFKNLINYADQTYPGHAIFVELVHNERLAHHLRHDPRFKVYDSYAYVTEDRSTADEWFVSSYICLREAAA